MPNQEKVQLTIYLPIEIRAELQALAAQKMLDHPKRNFSAASVAAELLIEYLIPDENKKKKGGEGNEN